MSAGNVRSMTERAKLHGIRGVLASLTPLCDCFSKPTKRQRRLEKIVETNELLKDYAAKSGSVYLDYYSALAEGQELRKEFTSDGMLPNDARYKNIAPPAKTANAEPLPR